MGSGYEPSRLRTCRLSIQTRPSPPSPLFSDTLACPHPPLTHVLQPHALALVELDGLVGGAAHIVARAVGRLGCNRRGASNGSRAAADDAVGMAGVRSKPCRARLMRRQRRQLQGQQLLQY